MPDTPSSTPLTTAQVTELRGWSAPRINALIKQGRLTPTKNERGENVFDAAQVAELELGQIGSGRPKGSLNKRPKKMAGWKGRELETPLD